MSNWGGTISGLLLATLVLATGVCLGGAIFGCSDCREGSAAWLGALGEWAGAIATFAAVLFALRVADKDSDERVRLRRIRAAAYFGQIHVELQPAALTIGIVVKLLIEAETTCSTESESKAAKLLASMQFRALEHACENADVFELEFAKTLGFLLGGLRDIQMSGESALEGRWDLAEGRFSDKMSNLVGGSLGLMAAVHEYVQSRMGVSQKSSVLYGLEKIEGHLEQLREIRRRRREGPQV